MLLFRLLGRSLFLAAGAVGRAAHRGLGVRAGGRRCRAPAVLLGRSRSPRVGAGTLPLQRVDPLGPVFPRPGGHFGCVRKTHLLGFAIEERLVVASCGSRVPQSAGAFRFPAGDLHGRPFLKGAESLGRFHLLLLSRGSRKTRLAAGRLAFGGDNGVGRSRGSTLLVLAPLGGGRKFLSEVPAPSLGALEVLLLSGKVAPDVTVPRFGVVGAPLGRQGNGRRKGFPRAASRPCCGGPHRRCLKSRSRI